mmetsp:Transcript_492/g.1311  ORF Transcript_492/g.1311 Transcript_492/m.1311 type:complete len:277 (-) Transcript_492:2979-3809(-)
MPVIEPDGRIKGKEVVHHDHGAAVPPDEVVQGRPAAGNARKFASPLQVRHVKVVHLSVVEDEIGNFGNDPLVLPVVVGARAWHQRRKESDQVAGEGLEFRHVPPQVLQEGDLGVDDLLGNPGVVNLLQPHVRHHDVAGTHWLQAVVLNRLHQCCGQEEANVVEAHPSQRPVKPWHGGFVEPQSGEDLLLVCAEGVQRARVAHQQGLVPEGHGPKAHEPSHGSPISNRMHPVHRQVGAHNVFFLVQRRLRDPLEGRPVRLADISFLHNVRDSNPHER